MDALTIEKLTVTYGGVVAVSDLDLDVGEGQCVGIVGANGAGKTSLLRGISGLVSTDRASRIHLFGKRVDGLLADQRARRGLGHVLEGRHIFGQLTVGENLSLAASRHYVTDGLTRVFDVLPELADRTQVKAGRLSGGQQQMLAIGRALMGNPAVLMLDEPTTGLAPLLVRRVAEIIETLKRRSLTVLVIEQRLDVAIEIADAIHVLSHGRIVHSTTAGGEDVRVAALKTYLE